MSSPGVPCGRGRCAGAGPALVLAAVTAAAGACTPSRGRMLEGEIVQAAQTGGRLELAKLYRAPWDRVCVLRPHTPAAAAERLVGFRFRGSGDMASRDDATGLVFVRGREIAARAFLPRTLDFSGGTPGNGYCSPRAGAVFDVRPGAGGTRVLTPAAP